MHASQQQQQQQPYVDTLRPGLQQLVIATLVIATQGLSPAAAPAAATAASVQRIQRNLQELQQLVIIEHEPPQPPRAPAAAAAAAGCINICQILLYCWATNWHTPAMQPPHLLRPVDCCSTVLLTDASYARSTAAQTPSS
jgi:hypothetical protein